MICDGQTDGPMDRKTTVEKTLSPANEGRHNEFSNFNTIFYKV